ALEGVYENENLQLQERFSDKEELKEYFNLIIKNDTISGTYQNDGQLLQVKLYKTEKNTHEYILQKLEFVRDSVSSFHNKEIVWITEKYSEKSLFRLGNGFKSSQRKFVNHKLDSIHTNYAIIGLECSWADFNVEIELVSDQYLSFSVYSSIYCGGAHPSHNTEGYNFDLINEQELHQITDLYPNLNHYNVLKEKYGDDTDVELECDYFTDNESTWEFYSWIMTDEGIVLTPSYPHAMTPCETGFLLTYKELE
ncbi:MAG: hypothetical protein ACSHWW_06305, partial [Nonlabens sp.]